MGCTAEPDTNTEESTNPSTSVCGNGVLDSEETCDGTCPTETDCDDGDPCTVESIVGGSSTCDAECTQTPIFQCIPNDGCCPSVGCVGLDNDCVPDEDEECLSGTTEERSCGLNEHGTKSRNCSDGAWDAWFPCDDEDVCVNGATQAGNTPCGPANDGKILQECFSGQWADRNPTDEENCEGAVGVCFEGGTRVGSTPCGFNQEGHLRQDCVAGFWNDREISDPADCHGGVDACLNGAKRSSAVACGLNLEGVIEDICVDGQWHTGTECSGEDVCDNDVQGSQECGAGDAGVQYRNCVSGMWGAWTGCSICEPGERDTTPCGINLSGVKERWCISRSFGWGAWVECNSTDICTNGTVNEIACGTTLEGTRIRTCENGQWGGFQPCIEPDVCVDNTTSETSCGETLEGTKLRTCSDGQWEEYGPCIEPEPYCGGSSSAQELEEGCQSGFDLFVAGDFVDEYRIPSIILTPNGTLIAAAEKRETNGDKSSNDIVVRRSSDGGWSWSAEEVVATANISFNDPNLAIAWNGDVYLFFNALPSQGGSIIGNPDNMAVRVPYYSRSVDDGASWTPPQVLAPSHPEAPSGFVVSPGRSLTLINGENVGELVIPIRVNHTTTSTSGLFDDVDIRAGTIRLQVNNTGITGATFGETNPSAEVDEFQITEMGTQNSLYYMSRDTDGLSWGETSRTRYSVSHDNGVTWNNDSTFGLFTTRTQSGLLRSDYEGETRYYYSTPTGIYDYSKGRHQGYIFETLPQGEGVTWKNSRKVKITDLYFGNSTLVDLGNRIGLIYEFAETIEGLNVGKVERIRFTSLTKEFIRSGENAWPWPAN